MHIQADQNEPVKEQIADLELVKDLYQHVYKGKKKCRILKQVEESWKVASFHSRVNLMFIYHAVTRNRNCLHSLLQVFALVPSP